ncbi:H+/gluconate symporter and related permeases [Fusobacterium polymorphum]|uniref:Possible MFS family major facilitator transporter n=1 Tax=Fusobacterium polymorphum ATCC 10953 TaxID=393480 RepID=A5TS01_FUSNP|nr:MULTISPECIES: YfcC family protein [Fusobacterium]EDK87676.1 possible MFS family major facilitator transporter [Fusobacterium polymorphum ATCC 10953]MCG6839236.1 YfcC family protein [Fusobacterium nucleatum]UTI53203.1 YfcC family protein [Fusobacterium polymorphum]WRL67721.1 YfcC family protein [Fusobacterium polymorphum]CKG63279.1 H+/gluconate symporter and related permeases [Fusobacterium polymorphum]
MKKKFVFPNTYVIIILMMIVAVLLTWIIPSGEFERVKDEVSKQSIIIPGTFKYIENNPISFLQIPVYIMKGLAKASDIVFLVIIVGGAFNIIIETGMFQSFAGRLTKVFSNKEVLIIPAFSTIFALACTTMGVNTFIGFAPIAVIIARSIGYDAIVGVSMVALGGAIGFSTGTFNPFTTGVAQSIAGLPIFSGVGYRFICLVVFLIVTNIYIIWYAKKVKANPEASVVYEMEQENKKVEVSEKQHDKIEGRHYLVLLIVIACFVLLVYGSQNWKWKLQENAAMFLWMGVLSGFAYGFGPSRIAEEFTKGAKKLVYGALMIGMANGISLILADGKILDTTVQYLGGLLVVLPSHAQAAGMFLMQLLINGLITSGSGQAAATMPIMLPVADIIGMTKQTAVLAFNFGDGLSNYILPTSSALMGFIAMVGISYSNWMKFMWRLFLIWTVVGAVLVIVANSINYGPF